MSSSSRPVASPLALLWTLVLILAGCIANNVVLEIIVSKRANVHADPGAGGLLTFLQFLFVAAANSGEAFTWRRPAAAGDDEGGKGHAGGAARRGGGSGGWCGGLLPQLRPPTVPLRHYAQMTLLFFSMSYLNNWAFQFNISQPLHMVFRSANLATTLMLGYFFFGQR